jgi:hypothetical protein
MFFFEKKNQKTFTRFGCGLSGESAAETSSAFCFFFVTTQVGRVLFGGVIPSAITSDS